MEMKNDENTMALIRKAQMDRIEINEHELESVTGGAYDTITDEMRRLVNSLIRRADYDLFKHFADISDHSNLTVEQINYWNQRYRLYYNALTEEEQRMVNAYIELSMQE